MKFLDPLKKIGLFLQKQGRPFLEQLKQLISSRGEEGRVPSKFNNGRGGFVGMDTQKELKDFQSKQKPTRPQASEEDLSKVLEDVLQKPAGEDKGLYAGKKTK